MALSQSLASQFAKMMNENTETTSPTKTVTGTAKIYGGDIYVQLDGSDLLTPIASSTVGMKDGDRITVEIANHSAVATGNASDPAASSNTVGNLEGEVTEASNKIDEFGTIIADVITTDDLEVINATIENLVANDVTITGELDAAKASIKDLEAENVTISGNLDAANANIDVIQSTMITTEVADAKYATIDNLDATNAYIYNLEATFGDFENLTTTNFGAVNAKIGELEAGKLDVESANVQFANIDFANIGEAAVEKIFADSGIIGDLVMQDGNVTGTLVGVTIKGDLIEGGTVVADKLVIKGDDGLFYKLNTDGESISAEQTEYNSLSGTVITAKSVTAEKINVSDLVAFDATIGGFQITNDSLYSGVKSSVDNTTRGTYMDNTGQFAIGDAFNYLKFFKDENDTWKLELSANSIRFGANGKDLDEATSEAVEEAIGDLDLRGIKSTVVDYQASTSGTEVPTGLWSSTIPSVSPGQYLWTRTTITYTDDTTTVSYSVGRFGQDGDAGSSGEVVTIVSTSVEYAVSSSGTSTPADGWSTTIPSVSPGQYLWTRITTNYSDETRTVAYSVARQGVDGTPGRDGVDGAPGRDGVDGTPGRDGVDGKDGRDGVDGKNGIDGVGVSGSTVSYQASSSGTDVPTGEWLLTIPVVSEGQYLWTRTVIQYTNGTQTISYSVARMGQNGVDGKPGEPGAPGAPGEPGRDGVDGAPGRDGVDGAPGRDGVDGADGVGIDSTSVTYQASDSQTVAPSGEWESTIPELTTSKPYLWTRTIITYTDGTSSISYSVSSTIDSIGVGYTNLLKYTDYSKDDGWYIRGDIYTGEIEDLGDENFNGRPSLKLTGSAAGAYGTNDVWQYLWSNKTSRPGENIMLSFYAKGSVAANMTARVDGASQSGISDAEVDITTDWTYYSLSLGPIENSGTNETSELIYIFDVAGTFWINSMKLEYGTIATDWSPAPEDIDQSLANAVEAANSAQEEVEKVKPVINEAVLDIDAIKNTISSLVTDENGSSLMTQTSDGWTFNISTIQNSIEEVGNSINDVSNRYDDLQSQVESVEASYDSVKDIPAYVRITQTSEGDPALILGRDDSEFKVQITNTEMAFMQGTEKIAYVTNRKLYIQASTVTDELQIGDLPGYVWKRRGNNHLGIRYVTS